MAVRARPFVHGRIQFTKAQKGHLQAEVGSVAVDEFKGFVEQERGMLVINRPDRAITLAARGGQEKRRVLKAARLSRSNVFFRSRDYRGKYRSGYRMPSTLHGRARGMLRSLSREGYKKPFILQGHERIPDGLYKFKGRRNKQKIVQLQAFDERVFVTKNPWMKAAIGKFLKRWDSRREWWFQFGRFAKKGYRPY